MTPERWQEVEETLYAAFELEESEQAAYVQRSCGTDPELLREVTSLLASHQRAEGFLAGRATDQLPDWTVGFAVSSEVGKRIGSYRLVEEIGRGGMSTVYLATHAGEGYEHRVAVKLVKRGLDTESVLRRFRSERRILASLSHPNIAHFYDGGSSDDARPYFVMEHIEGTRIDEYCDQLGLSIAERLELFRQVCSAVHYAHQNLIIHRDIKPPNILVGNDGVPKLLDFGIAKLLDPQSSADNAETTLAGLRPMTPDYASPEQLLGQRIITTASDVYSLGIVLHKILTSRLPEKRPAESAQRNGAVSPAQDHHRLTGDLQKIVYMALREEPARRYASVEQFSEDLRRYLAGHPVSAQHDTLRYRTGKFLRRHRYAAGAAAVFLVLLGIFVAALARQVEETARERDRAQLERDRAELERDKAEQVADLLFDLFESVDPNTTRGDSVTAGDLLERGVEKVERQLDDQKPLQAAAFDLIGRVYRSLGIYDRALPLIERGLALRREVLGADHLDVTASLTHLGATFAVTGDYGRAESLHREALDIRRKRLGNEHLEVADSLSHLAITLWYQGRYEEAEHLQRQALDLQRELLDEDDLAVSTSLSNLATIFFARGEVRAAEEFSRESLDIERKVLGDDHPNVATTLHNLGASLAQQKSHEAAELLFREALEIRRKVFGEEHPDVAEAMHGLGSLLAATGEQEEAEQLLRASLEMRRGFLGENHVGLATNLSTLGALLYSKGDFEAAAAILRRSVDIGRRVVPPGHPGLAFGLIHLGRALLQKGDAQGAEPVLREAYELRQKALPETSSLTAEAAGALGACLAALGKYGEAEQRLLESHQILKAHQGGPQGLPPDTLRRVLSHLVSFYDTRDQPEKADEYREELAVLSNTSTTF